MKPALKWGLASIAFLVLVFLILPPIPKTKAKPLRVNSVNSVQNVTVSWPLTNVAVPAVPSATR